MSDKNKQVKPASSRKEFWLKKMLPFSLTFIAIILDQVTKCLVVKNIPVLTFFSEEGDGSIIPVFGSVLRLIHVKNNAVAFSIGSGLPATVRTVLFSIVPVIVIGIVIAIYFRNNEFTGLQRWSICALIGGGLGNLIDRIFRGDGVVDFIDFIWFGWKKSPFEFLRWDRWPTFNVADCFVVVACILFIISFIVYAARDRKNSRESK